MTVVFGKQGIGVHQRVLVAEESPHVFLLLLRCVHEALLLHITILLYHRLGDDELLHAVLSRVLEGLLAHHAVRAHCVGDAQGGVHEYSVVPMQLLGIHSSHRRSYDEVGLFALCHLAQHGNSLVRVNGDIVRNDSCRRQHRAYSGHRSAACRRAEAVNIHYLLALHEVGELLLILVFHISAFSIRSFKWHWSPALPLRLPCIDGKTTAVLLPQGTPLPCRGGAGVGSVSYEPSYK